MDGHHGFGGALLAIATLSSVPACALFCPAEPPAVVANFSLTTPAGTFDSFRNALEADSPYHEYQCLAAAFLRENDIDYQKYVLGRPYFLRKYRDDVRRFRKSDVVDIRYDVAPEGAPIATVILSDGKLEGQFVLIDEPYWEIELRDGPLDLPLELFSDPDEDGIVVPGDHFEIEDGELIVRTPLRVEKGIPMPAPDDIVSFELKHEWKVLSFLGLRDALKSVEEGAEQGRTGAQPSAPSAGDHKAGPDT